MSEIRVLLQVIFIGQQSYNKGGFVEIKGIDLSRNKCYIPKYETQHITSASILVTENCNLACTYCYEKHNKKRMSLDTARRSVEFLYENGLKKFEKTKKPVECHLMVFGGEPTLEPDVLEELLISSEELEKQSKGKVKFTTSMVTNCTIMTPRLKKLFEYWSRKHISVQLSIDGIPEVQNKYRITKGGGPSFHLVEKVIPQWKEIFKHKPTALSVHGCINKFSLPYLFKSYKFFRENWNMPRIWFIPVCEEDWSEDDVALYEQEMFKIYNYFMKIVKIQNTLKEAENYAPLDRSMKSRKGFGKPCGAGTNYMTITSDGQLYPCHQIYFKDELNETWCGDIWNGPDDNRRRFFMEYDSKDMTCPEECDHYWCYRCIAVNWFVNKSPLAQVRGNYCKLMKVDQKIQKIMREELINMGLLDGKNTDSGDDCLCNTRKSDACKCNVRQTDACKCNVRATQQETSCKCDSRGSNLRTCDIVDIGKERFMEENPQEFKDQELDRFIDNGVEYIKYLKPDGSIYLKEVSINKKNSSSSCGGCDNSQNIQKSMVDALAHLLRITTDIKNILENKK